MEKNKWRVVLVAKDIAPSQALDLLARKIAEDGNDCLSIPFLAFGKGYTPDFDGVIESSISGAHAVCVGMSSSPELAKEEIDAAKLALSKGIRVFCYADTFGLKTHFEDILSQPGVTLFHLNDEQERLAREKYPNLKVVVTGNPMWEKFFFPKLTREQSREKLEIGLVEKVLLCPGGKDREINKLHITKVIEDLNLMLDKGVVFKLIFSLHGGDNTPIEDYSELTQLATERQVEFRIVQSSEMTGPEVLSAADLVVGSASTIGFEAISRHDPIPSFNYFSPQALARFKKITGLEQWEYVTQGVIPEWPGSDGYIFAITQWQNVTLPRIKELYPAPTELGVSLNRMVHAIFS